MSTHPATHLLSAYLDRELHDEEKQVVARHVEECSGCQHRLDGLRRVIDELRSIPAAQPPELLTRRIEGHLARAWRERRVQSPLARGQGELLAQPGLRLGFALVISLALMTLIFAQGLSRRDHSGTTLVVPPEATVVDPAEGQSLEIGGRVFGFRTGRWVEVGLETAATRILVTSSAEARQLLEGQQWLSELLAPGRGVVLAWEGEVLELVPLPQLKKSQERGS